jgi:hypothetical protein
MLLLYQLFLKLPISNNPDDPYIIYTDTQQLYNEKQIKMTSVHTCTLINTITVGCTVLSVGKNVMKLSA